MSRLHFLLFFNSWLLDFHVLGKREMMPKPPPHYFFRLPTQRWNIWWSGQKMSKFNFLVHWIFTWHDMSHFSMSVFQLRVSPALSAGWNIFTNLLGRKILFEPMFEPALRCLLGSIISGRKKGSRCYVVHQYSSKTTRNIPLRNSSCRFFSLRKKLSLGVRTCF